MDLRPRPIAIARAVAGIAMATLALATPGCTGINLDPMSHHEFPRASAAETAPPAELVKGTAQ